MEQDRAANRRIHGAPGRLMRWNLSRLRLVAIAAPIVFAVGLGLLTEEVLQTFVSQQLSHLIASLILTLAVVLFASWIFSLLNHMTAELEAHADRERQDAQIMARMEERERIGLELHDGVIQSIYAIQLSLEDGLQEQEPGSPVAARFDNAIDALTEVAQQMRRYIFGLRPSLAGAHDLPRALEDLLRDVRVNTTAETELSIEGRGLDGLKEPTAHALFSIAQQAAGSAARRGATCIQIYLRTGASEVVMEITDNGHKCAWGEADSLPLRDMEALAQAVSGTFKVEDRILEGTLVLAAVPVTESARSGARLVESRRSTFSDGNSGHGPSLPRAGKRAER